MNLAAAMDVWLAIGGGLALFAIFVAGVFFGGWMMLESMDADHAWEQHVQDCNGEPICRCAAFHPEQRERRAHGQNRDQPSR